MEDASDAAGVGNLVSLMDRCLLWTGICYGEVSVVDWCLLQLDVCYEQQ